MNYYQLLEISQDASQEDIKKAYKVMLKKYHPDNFHGDKQKEKDAEDKTKEIILAYETLSDPLARRQYDEELESKRTYKQSNTYQAYTNNTSQSHQQTKQETNYNTTRSHTTHSQQFNNQTTDNGEFKKDNIRKKRKSKLVYIVPAAVFFLCMLGSSDTTSAAPAKNTTQQSQSVVNQGVPIKTEKDIPQVEVINEITEQEKYQKDYSYLKNYAEQFVQIINDNEEHFNSNFYSREWLTNLETQVNKWQKEFSKQQMKTKEGKRLQKSLIQLSNGLTLSYNKMCDGFTEHFDLFISYALDGISEEELLKQLGLDTIMQETNEIMKSAEEDIKVFESYVSSNMKTSDIDFIKNNMNINQVPKTIQKEVDIASQESSSSNETTLTNYYIFSDSSSRYLTVNDLQGLSVYDLKIARNEIYARHGYIFESQELLDYFSKQEWYHPTIPASQFNNSKLNDIEIYNVDLIKQYESQKSESTVKSPSKATYTDNQFTENVIGFDLVSFANRTFDTVDDMYAFLAQYEFYRHPDMWGDEGGINVIDGLETELSIGRENYYTNKWTADSITAYVPSYVAYMNEVQKICDPYGTNPMQFEYGYYFYEVEIDGVQVRYNFTPDSLREANPIVNNLTITLNR